MTEFGQGGDGDTLAGSLLIAKDGVVEQLNVEQGGEFRVSSADYLLGQLQPA